MTDWHWTHSPATLLFGPTVFIERSERSRLTVDWSVQVQDPVDVSDA